jgi:hypothetical protein
MFFDRSFSKEPAENIHVVPFALTPAHNGVLVVEAQPQRKGRPAAAGRELMRLVRCR